MAMRKVQRLTTGRRDDRTVGYGGFPLVTGRLSLDLVNTEVVRRGKRIDLLQTSDDLARWLQTVEEAGGLARQSLPADFDCAKALPQMLRLRAFLRRGFEAIADGELRTTQQLHAEWGAPLERLVAKAPLAYRATEGSLIPVPQGPAADALVSLTALDALQLLAAGDLTKVRRCANPDCVLLFLDTTGRKKWCSMKLCGNRMKVARHQSRRGRAHKA